MKSEISMLTVSLSNLEGYGLYELENNKISQELVDKFIVKKEITTETVFGKLTTVLKYELANGFVGIETTACVDAIEYSKEMGSEMLLAKLKDIVWFGLEFALGMGQSDKA